MMRRMQNQSVYAALLLLNVAVVLMFMVVLQPRPWEVIAAAGPVRTASVRVTDRPDQIAKQGIPRRVVIPSIGVDVSVKPGSYEAESGQWTLDHSAAFFADRTVPVNTSNGTTFLYAHAVDGLFGRLPELREGARAAVYTDTNLVFHYVFTLSREVLPRDTSALTSSGPPTLLLQTCSGPLDAYRTLVSLRLSEVTHE